jgi:hypothetical protein
MNITKKGIVAIILASVVVASAVTYALITVNVPVQNHIKILGGALDLWKKNDDESYTYQYLTEDFNGHMTGDVIESPLLVLVSDAANTVNFALNFSDTLPDNVGIILWQVEVYYNFGQGNFGWKWFNWTTSQIVYNLETGATMYLPGTPQNPITPGQKLGLRPATPNLGSVGHLKYTLYVSPTAPCGDYPFDMTITGTQV